jgi:hypothetical protein
MDGGWISIQTDRQAGRQTDRQADRQTSKQGAILELDTLACVLSQLAYYKQKNKHKNRQTNKCLGSLGIRVWNDQCIRCSKTALMLGFECDILLMVCDNAVFMEV